MTIIGRGKRKDSTLGQMLRNWNICALLLVYQKWCCHCGKQCAILQKIKHVNPLLYICPKNPLIPNSYVSAKSSKDQGLGERFLYPYSQNLPKRGSKPKCPAGR